MYLFLVSLKHTCYISKLLNKNNSLLGFDFVDALSLKMISAFVSVSYIEILIHFLNLSFLVYLA